MAAVVLGVQGVAPGEAADLAFMPGHGPRMYAAAGAAPPALLSAVARLPWPGLPCPYLKPYL